MIPKWDVEKVHMEGVGRGEIPTFFLSSSKEIMLES